MRARREHKDRAAAWWRPFIFRKQNFDISKIVKASYDVKPIALKSGEIHLFDVVVSVYALGVSPG